MSNCGFCEVCNIKRCPKKGLSKPVSMQQISLYPALYKRLQKFCEKKDFVRGEDYYKVADFNTAVSFLLKEHSKKRKK